MSRATRDDAPWKKWEPQMMKKTALRSPSKLLPKSSDIDAFLRRDEEESLGDETSEAIADQRGEAFGSVLDHFAETGRSETTEAPVTDDATKGTASSAARESMSGGPQDADQQKITPEGPAAPDDALATTPRPAEIPRIGAGRNRCSNRLTDVLVWGQPIARQ